MRAPAEFCCSLVLYLFILTSLVCVTSSSSSRSRHFAPNGGSLSAHFNQVTVHTPPQIPQNSNHEGMKKRIRMEMVEEEEEAKKYKEINKIGSSPPSCEHKCYGCMPCEPIQVPTTSSRVGVQYTNYEPEGWKCKCGPTFYTP